MKGPTVRLKIRVRLNDGSYPFLEPVFANNRKIKPLYALVDGKPEHHPEGCYYLRYLRADGKRTWESVGTDAHLAEQRRKLVLSGKANEVNAIEKSNSEDTSKTQKTALPRLDAAIKTYLKDTKNYKSKKTFAAYSKTLGLFTACCRKTCLNDLDRRDVLNFVDYLKRQGNGRRTVANRISYLLIFLRKQGIKEIIRPSDLPRYTAKIVKSYSESQLKALFVAADIEEQTLFHFFLGSGCRDNEVVHACWENVDFQAKTYDVREKLDLSFELKDHEERTVPLNDILTAR